MKPVSSTQLDALWQDFDAREVQLREIVRERLAEQPAPTIQDQVVASYFFASRAQRLPQLAAEICYHATSGIRKPPAGTLLAECTGSSVGIDAFDTGQRVGLVHIAYPLKMLLHPDGHLTSCDLLHTLAGAIIFDIYESQDARLLQLNIPERVVQTFPGPRYGPKLLRQKTGFATNEPAFGTILKPTAGITPTEVGTLVEEAAKSSLFMFIKEDENLYPNLDYSPVKVRTRNAIDAITRAREHRDGKGLIYAPHISGSPHEMLDTTFAAIDAGATGLMFSESFAGGTVRMVREATRHLEEPPAIYGHNAGIGVKTRSIWREVIDYLARLDGIDFRQTAPVRYGLPFIRPYGAEWRASEEILMRPIAGLNQTMIARAGGLDQGNIIMNLEDAESQGIVGEVLFLAGSAINSIKNAQGRAEPQLGAEAMCQAIEVHRSGEMRGVAPERHAETLLELAQARGLNALREALKQRYPGMAA